MTTQWRMFMFFIIPFYPFIELLIYITKIAESKFREEVILNKSKQSFNLSFSLGVSNRSKYGSYAQSFADLLKSGAPLSPMTLELCSLIRVYLRWYSMLFDCPPKYFKYILFSHLCNKSSANNLSWMIINKHKQINQANALYYYPFHKIYLPQTVRPWPFKIMIHFECLFNPFIFTYCFQHSPHSLTMQRYLMPLKKYISYLSTTPTSILSLNTNNDLPYIIGNWIQTATWFVKKAFDTAFIVSMNPAFHCFPSNPCFSSPFRNGHVTISNEENILQTLLNIFQIVNRFHNITCL